LSSDPYPSERSLIALHALEQESIGKQLAARADVDHLRHLGLADGSPADGRHHGRRPSAWFCGDNPRFSQWGLLACKTSLCAEVPHNCGHSGSWWLRVKNRSVPGAAPRRWASGATPCPTFPFCRLVIQTAENSWAERALDTLTGLSLRGGRDYAGMLFRPGSSRSTRNQAFSPDAGHQPEGTAGLGITEGRVARGPAEQFEKAVGVVRGWRYGGCHR
jgi:hypothetical protein